MSSVEISARACVATFRLASVEAARIVEGQHLIHSDGMPDSFFVAPYVAVLSAVRAAASMCTVATVHKQVHHRAREQKEPREGPEEMGAVLTD